ncbi:MAG TPA: hypothetical protein VFN69_02950 [Rudaea sp.]|nr:hypothetical protein [Rudaea sp.]
MLLVQGDRQQWRSLCLFWIIEKPGILPRFPIKRPRQGRVTFAESAPEQSIRGTSVCRVRCFASRIAVEFCTLRPYADGIHFLEEIP